MNITDVNSMPQDSYVSVFGDIAEKSPWLTLRTLRFAPFATREAMVVAFNTVLLKSSEAEKLAVIRAHPDLATKVKLSDTSAKEQKGVGLDSLSAEEFAHFTALNDAYKARFGFPFIFAVKGATRQQIIESFERRVKAERKDEFALALEMICRIMRFRLEDRISTE